tara:strand:- start:254 stop:382 length:129 start_codon:yes stop_codon:yes gene_type:complete
MSKKELEKEIKELKKENKRLEKLEILLITISKGMFINTSFDY